MLIWSCHSCTNGGEANASAQYTGFFSHKFVQLSSRVIMIKVNYLSDTRARSEPIGVPADPSCVLDMNPGLVVGNYTVPRYYYDRLTGTCKLFKYGGCGGNPNNFATEDDCLKRCLPRPCVCKYCFNVRHNILKLVSCISILEKRAALSQTLVGARARSAFTRYSVLSSRYSTWNG